MNVGFRVIIVMGIVVTALLGVLADFHKRQQSVAAYRPTFVRVAAETSVGLVGSVRDRDGRLILARELVDVDGVRVAQIHYYYGQALAAVSTGRRRLVTGMLRSLRAPGVEAPWASPELTGWYRTLLGDGCLCPRSLPDELVTTLDAALCVRIYKLLKATGKPVASVVVLNKNAEALALVSYPGPDVEESDRLPDPAHSLSVFLSCFPGSTMKAIVAAYMLESGRGDVDAAVVCPGGSQCWSKHGLTRGLQQALVRSCNPYFRFQAGSFPETEFYAYLANVGFFQEAALGVPSVPAVMPAHTSGTVDPGTAIGTQILTSPLSLACAYGTITDPEGHRFTPRVFLKADGQPLPVPDRPQVLRPEVTAAIRTHLKAVADRGTAAEVGRLLHRRACAKTGTANGSALLAVVTPVDTPEFVVLVRVEGAPSGASLSNLAAEIVRAAEEECH